jgi:hypothetical protein
VCEQIQTTRTHTPLTSGSESQWGPVSGAQQDVSRHSLQSALQVRALGTALSSATKWRAAHAKWRASIDNGWSAYSALLAIPCFRTTGPLANSQSCVLCKLLHGAPATTSSSHAMQRVSIDNSSRRSEITLHRLAGECPPACVAATTKATADRGLASCWRWLRDDTGSGVDASARDAANAWLRRTDERTHSSLSAPESPVARQHRRGCSRWP